ncbi:hypothetical protein E3T46_00800 [Cryobacterium sp. Hh11]|nr:hypothetical protein E3T46_00800 [Cryobacterium sp. Hh11]
MCKACNNLDRNGVVVSADKEVDGTVLSPRDKGLPARAAGMSVEQFLATTPRLSEFWTPLLVLSDDALAHNLAVMADWCTRHGFSLMPHGKTTMAPTLWQRQLEAGAHGITLATAGQVRIARDFGFGSIMLANALTDARGLRFVAAELADPAFSFSCWVDSVETVELMERALTGVELARPINVCVELGAAGGRTGARTAADASVVAKRIRQSAVLRLAGVAGYEGCLAHDRSEQGLAAVRGYLEKMLALHTSLADDYDDQEVILTAGGSAYFDIVDEVFNAVNNPLPRTRYVLRSGAYLTHDDGFYRGISPLDPSRLDDPDPAQALRPAMRGLARVVSRPEPGLALLDAGKRDFPYDEGLPVPFACSPDLGSAGSTKLAGASVSAMNDQHSFLRLAPEQELAIGAVVALGLSHPCTAFDKWQYIPVVQSAQSDLVVGLVRTYF